MKRILDPGSSVRLAPEKLGVGLVFGEEELRRAGAGAVTGERVVAKFGVRGADRSCNLAQVGLWRSGFPRPGVAKPQRREQMEPGGFRPAVVDGNPDQDVVRAVFSVLEKDVEVPVVVEDAGVDQLVLELLPRPALVSFHQVPVREFPLRVFVEILHIRVRRRCVDVEVALLDVLAVVPLAVGDPEETLLEDGVALVPQREGKTEALLVIREAADAILAPAVGPRPGLVVAKIRPRVAVLAVVLADRAPLPLAQVRAPLLPGSARLSGLVQPLLLRHVHEGGRRRRLLSSPSRRRIF